MSLDPAPESGPWWQGRAVPLAGIGIVAALSWAYLLHMAAAMSGMGGGMAAMDGAKPGSMAMAMDMSARAWGAADWLAMLVMWWVMMAAMMLPSAAQMILTFSTINRRRRSRGEPHVATVVFVAGYLIAWGGYSVAATAAQWGLESLALVADMMSPADPALGGTLLLAAGIYQFTPLKHACLRHCRSPFDFIMNRWREGTGGALAMGIEHGLYCLGCCWVMMALLFVFGVMNLLWIAALTVLVIVEKAVPGGHWAARAGGVAMAAAGLVLLIAPEMVGLAG